ncbi:MAG: deoxyribose-phosphate aldolase, partial [Terriglobales bacterium]
MIDHSLVNPVLTTLELEAGIRLALAFETATVCVMPHYLPRCVELLAGSAVGPGTTVGFPHGSQTIGAKRAEAEEALRAGAVELDMVANISRARSSDWEYLAEEIEELAQAAHGADAKLKVIFENCYLETGGKIRLCEICAAAGADWVKTSTGFGSGGATMDDLALMRRHCPARVGVKAAGGIRTFDALLEARALGVSRIGATRTAAILDECRRRLELAPIAAEAPTPAGAY